MRASRIPVFPEFDVTVVLLSLERKNAETVGYYSSLPTIDLGFWSVKYLLRAFPIREAY